MVDAHDTYFRLLCANVKHCVIKLKLKNKINWYISQFKKVTFKQYDILKA